MSRTTTPTAIPSQLHTWMARRSFLARLAAGAGILGATAISPSAAMAQTAVPPLGGASWRPARYQQDDWYDEIPGTHRFVFDATTPEAVASAIRFANNYYGTSESAYSLKDSDLAVLIIVRHRATSFGFSDAIWAKYSKQLQFTDPKTKELATLNVYAQPNQAVGDAPAGALLSLIKRGTHFGVCATAARGVAQTIARGTSQDVDAVFKEIGASLLCPNARMVPAGILAVNRAQEHGYSFVSAG